jgi:epoxyqueuosine reductase
VVLALSYAPAFDPLSLLSRPERGSISVYARGQDYHDLVKSKLKSLARWMVSQFGGDLKVFVDTAPVMEKPLAASSGLGWQGKHTNLLSRRLGNWFFLGEIYSTLDLPPDEPEADHCGTCTRCQDACPTGALVDGKMDARRCISYLTIEHKGPIDPALRELMGNRIYGCDDCLAACPWNKFATHHCQSAFNPRIELQAPLLQDFVGLDDEGFRAVFSGSPIKRIGRDRFIRNVVIAIGNSGLSSLIPHLERLLDDGSAVVRGASIWALRRLLAPDCFDDLRRQRADSESDPSVRSEWT